MLRLNLNHRTPSHGSEHTEKERSKMKPKPHDVIIDGTPFMVQITGVGNHEIFVWREARKGKPLPRGGVGKDSPAGYYGTDYHFGCMKQALKRCATLDAQHADTITDYIKRLEAFDGKHNEKRD
jgi:hypothetical protein